ncbi:MAG: hypothetical protein AB8E87_12880, partial [Prochlorococcus sp.]
MAVNKPLRWSDGAAQLTVAVPGPRFADPWIFWRGLAGWGDFPPTHGSAWTVCPAFVAAPQSLWPDMEAT